MARFLPLLALAPLCALAAAPVPPGARVPFGRDDLLSRADLEKVAFASFPDLDRDGKPRDDDERYDDPKRGDGADAPLRTNRYDLAVYLPWNRFAAGNPMPVYLVLRNNRDATLGLRSHIDLSGPTPWLHGGGIDVGVRERGSQKSVLAPLTHATNCGGGSLVDVPPLGFYCVRGDLNRLCGGLRPGEYEVDWRVGRLRSAAVPFTVVQSAAPLAARAKVESSHLQFYHLTPGSEGSQLRWPDARLEHVRSARMTAALAVGQGGAYVPDVRAIPSADRRIEARLVWKPYRDGDRVAVTLAARAPGPEVRFAALPQLFLQIEMPDEDRAAWELEAREALKDARENGRCALATPLTIELRLPDRWRERLGTAGRARVSVLVSSERVEFPRGSAALAEKLQELKVDRADEVPRPVYWSGILRTDAIEVAVPPHGFPQAGSQVPVELR